jgi:predicted DNA-binding transcriptional regulator AlpA
MQSIISAPVSLPSTGFLRLSQIVGKPDSVSALIPISKSTWWAGVKSGRYPQPVKLSPRVTVWRVEDIRALIASASEVAA